MLEKVTGKGELTRLKILLILAKNKGTSLTSIGTSLGISTQAVSNHIKEMGDQGWVEKESGGYLVAREGLNHLAAGALDLKDFLSEVYSTLSYMDHVEAFAASKMERGRRVSLCMKNGMIIADRDTKDRGGARGGATGRAATSASKGGPVLVNDVKGVIDIPEGKLTILQTGPLPMEDWIQGMKKKIEARDWDHIGAYGVIPSAALNELALAPDFRIAPVQACVECAMKGMNALLLVGERDVPHVVMLMAREFDYWGKSVDYDIIHG